MATTSTEKKGRLSSQRLCMCACASIPVGVTLERPIDLDADVVGLLLAESRQFGAQGWKVQARNLLIELLRKQVDIFLVALLFCLEEVQLSKHLIREGARHDERGVASSTAKIEKASGREHDDTMSIWE